MLGYGILCPRQCVQEVSRSRRGHEMLLPVKDIAIAVFHRSQRDIGFIRPGIGLGKSLIPDYLSPGNRGQKPLLLLLGAEDMQGRTAHTQPQ